MSHFSPQLTRIASEINEIRVLFISIKLWVIHKNWIWLISHFIYALLKKRLALLKSFTHKDSSITVFRIYGAVLTCSLKSVMRVNCTASVHRRWKLVSGVLLYFIKRKPLTNYEKCFLFHLKRSFGSWDILIFVIILEKLSISTS